MFDIRLNKLVHAQISKKALGLGPLFKSLDPKVHNMLLYKLQKCFFFLQLFVVKFTKKAFQPQIFDKKSTKHYMGCFIFDALYFYQILYRLDPLNCDEIKKKKLERPKAVSTTHADKLIIYG